jgi:hypothetical protein
LNKTRQNAKAANYYIFKADKTQKRPIITSLNPKTSCGEALLFNKRSKHQCNGFANAINGQNKLRRAVIIQ